MGVRLPSWRAVCRRRHGTDLPPICHRHVACMVASPRAGGVAAIALCRRLTRARSVLNSDCAAGDDAARVRQASAWLLQRMWSTMPLGFSCVCARASGGAAMSHWEPLRFQNHPHPCSMRRLLRSRRLRGACERERAGATCWQTHRCTADLLRRLADRSCSPYRAMVTFSGVRWCAAPDEGKCVATQVGRGGGASPCALTARRLGPDPHSSFLPRGFVQIFSNLLSLGFARTLSNLLPRGFARTLTPTPLPMGEGLYRLMGLLRECP